MYVNFNLWGVVGDWLLPFPRFQTPHTTNHTKIVIVLILCFQSSSNYLFLAEQSVVQNWWEIQFNPNLFCFQKHKNWLLTRHGGINSWHKSKSSEIDTVSVSVSVSVSTFDKNYDSIGFWSRKESIILDFSLNILRKELIDSLGFCLYCWETGILVLDFGLYIINEFFQPKMSLNNREFLILKEKGRGVRETEGWASGSAGKHI